MRVFENSCNSLDIDKAYKVINLQIIRYKNKRKVETTSLTNVLECDLDLPHLEEDELTISEGQETLTKEEQDTIIFDNVSGNSLLSQCA